jgi:hypothetical protein
MSHTDTQIPIPVLVANAGEVGGKPRRHRVATFRTRNLTAANPIVHLCPYDETRLYIQIQAGGSNVVLCTDISQAQDPCNQVAGVPNPDGLLLTAGNTMPFRLEGSQHIYAVGNTFPSQLTWVTVHESGVAANG